MSEKKAPALDPMRAWRDWFVSAEKDWSEGLTALMKDETVAKTMGQDFNAALHRQQMFAEVIGQMLAKLNLPSRDDVLALGERMGRIEDGLAAVQASLSQLAAGAAGKAALPASARPPRTRKPPAAAAPPSVAARRPSAKGGRR